MREYNNILKIVFGFDDLKEFQKNVINSSLKRDDILVISPTGSGKSLCFQLPAVMNEGITIVLSPLKSLIYDQIETLKKKDISCYLLNGDLKEREKNVVLNELRKDYPNIKLLYTTPESILGNEEIKECIINLYKKNLINRFVLDEAHCISTWGNDFRPHYLKVRKLKQEYKRVPIIALTATATERVKKDILDILQLKDVKIFQSSFLKTNLNINIKFRGSKKKDELETIEEIGNDLKTKYKNKCGILYAFSRKKCEEISNKLKDIGIKSEYFHAGMSCKKRNEIQTQWLEDEIQIICATIAFGMGIDKPNVRIIYHFNLPKTIENYYQEIGRGGRDKKQSDCILYYNETDNILYQKINEYKSKEKQNDYFKERNKELQKYEQQKIYDMINFCENKYDCRHIALCNYFGEKRKEKIGFCNVCDICKLYNKNNIKYKKQNVTDSCKKIIELISRTHNPTKNNIIKKIVGYPKKNDKKRRKKEFKNNDEWNKYKLKYENMKNEINNYNDNYNNQEKHIKRIILKLIINKYINIDLFKKGSGYNRIWHEELKLYEKCKKIINNEKKIYI